MKWRCNCAVNKAPVSSFVEEELGILIFMPNTATSFMVA